MSPRTPLNKNLIMRRIAERQSHPSQVQSAPSTGTSPATTTDSDLTLRSPHDRWEYVP
jgi:hypothetical protein